MCFSAISKRTVTIQYYRQTCMSKLKKRQMFSLRNISVQQFPSYKATTSAMGKWPYKRGGLSWGGETISKYTSPPLIILLLLQWESGLIRREVTLEGNSLLIIYYLSASKIWPEKTTFGGRGIIRGRLLYSVIWDN